MIKATSLDLRIEQFKSSGNNFLRMGVMIRTTPMLKKFLKTN